MLAFPELLAFAVAILIAVAFHIITNTYQL